MSDLRHEWRGDAFAADLDALLDRLRPLPLLPRAFEHTLTAFLQPQGVDDLDLKKIKRVRAYRSLASVDEAAIAALLATGIAGTLQAKARSGAMRSFGPAIVTAAGIEASGLQARSLRVSRRLHYSFAGGDDPERMRITLDLDRHLFRIVDGNPHWLGQLGPRVEIKAPGRAQIETVRARFGLDALARRQPNRSLELLFQDMLRERVTPAPSSYPEIELKFDLPGGGVPASVLLAALGAVRPLLPAPHLVERSRRYHVCRDPGGGETTIVETASGRLSLKRKANAVMIGPVLLRDTIASRTTDRTGTTQPLAAFAAAHGVEIVSSFEKVQAKLPFALPDGRSFLVSVDHCRGANGPTLDQLELEYIGTTTGETPTPAAIADTLDGLGRRLLSGPLGPRLRPGGRSKHAFFSDQALRRAS